MHIHCACPRNWNFKHGLLLFLMLLIIAAHCQRAISCGKEFLLSFSQGSNGPLLHLDMHQHPAAQKFSRQRTPQASPIAASLLKAAGPSMALIGGIQASAIENMDSLSKADLSTWPWVPLVMGMVLLVMSSVAVVALNYNNFIQKRRTSVPKLEEFPVLPPVKFPERAPQSVALNAPLLTTFAECTIRSWRSEDALPVLYLVKQVQRWGENALNVEGDEADCLDADQVYAAQGGIFLIAERDGRVTACGALALNGDFNASLDIQKTTGSVAQIKRMCLDPEWSAVKAMAELLPFMMSILLHFARDQGAQKVVTIAYPTSRFPGTQPTPELVDQLGMSYQRIIPDTDAALFEAVVCGPGSVLLQQHIGLIDLVDIIAVDGTILGRFPRQFAEEHRLLYK